MTEQSPLQIPTAKRAVGLFRVLIILALTILAVYVCYLLVLPFLPALAWALTLTLLFLPVHEQIEESVRRQNVAAAVSVVLIAVVVAVPGILLGNRLIQEAASGAAMINERLSSLTRQINLVRQLEQMGERSAQGQARRKQGDEERNIISGRARSIQ